MESVRFELRFAVLRHEGHGEGHFDLLFETAKGSKLAAWRSANWPVREKSIVTPLPHHRSAYLDYEGEVSGGRGFVKRVAEGRHRIREASAERLVIEMEDGSVLSLPRRMEGPVEIISAG